jgi:2-methylisocitrate lyase-like PEP mutase family enzyme
MSLDREFDALHAGPDLLVLPNAWDAGSVAVIEAAGAKAIATSSAAVSWSYGYPDEALPFGQLVAAVAAIVRAVRIPVSADIVAGYATDGASIEDPIARILDVGAVGVNIEDGHEAPEVLVAKIEHARSVAARKGIALWINARTDVYLRKLVPASDAAALAKLGVRRLSAGGWLARAAYNRAFCDALAFLAEGHVGVFTNPEISVPPLNDLMRR